jgi:hypothetical protein
MRQRDDPTDGDDRHSASLTGLLVQYSAVEKKQEEKRGKTTRATQKHLQQAGQEEYCQRNLHLAPRV